MNFRFVRCLSMTTYLGETTCAFGKQSKQIGWNGLYSVLFQSADASIVAVNINGAGFSAGNLV